MRSASGLTRAGTTDRMLFVTGHKTEGLRGPRRSVRVTPVFVLGGQRQGQVSVTLAICRGGPILAALEMKDAWMRGGRPGLGVRVNSDN